MSGTPRQRSTEHPPQAVPSSRLLSQRLTQGLLSYVLALPYKSWMSLLLECQMLLINKYCKALHLIHILQQQFPQVSLFILENNTFSKGKDSKYLPVAGVWDMVRTHSIHFLYQPLSDISFSYTIQPHPSIPTCVWTFHSGYCFSCSSTFLSLKPGLSLILIPPYSGWSCLKTKQLQVNFVFPETGNSQSTRGHHHSSGFLFMDSKILFVPELRMRQASPQMWSQECHGILRCWRRDANELILIMPPQSWWCLLSRDKAAWALCHHDRSTKVCDVFSIHKEKGESCLCVAGSQCSLLCLLLLFLLLCLLSSHTWPSAGPLGQVQDTP